MVRDGALSLDDLSRMPHAVAEFAAAGDRRRPLEVAVEDQGLADRNVLVQVTSLLTLYVVTRVWTKAFWRSREDAPEGHLSAAAPSVLLDEPEDIQFVDRDHVGRMPVGMLLPTGALIGPDGSLADKAMDLEAHRTGVFAIAGLIEEEVRVKVVGETALTFVALAIRGTINGADVSGRYRYTRTWTRAGGAWQVVGAHISPAG